MLIVFTPPSRLSVHNQTSSEIKSAFMLNMSEPFPFVLCNIDRIIRIAMLESFACFLHQL